MATRKPITVDDLGTIHAQSVILSSGGKLIDATSTTDVIYICEAEPGVATSAALWRIKKVSFPPTASFILVQWADGDQRFNNVCDDRTSLSYS